MIKSKNELLKKAEAIVNEKGFTDDCYNDLETLFKGTTKEKRNNAKAYLKKDLALVSVFSDILAILAIILSIKLVGNDALNNLIVSVLVLIFALIYAFLLIPAIKQENYVLSIIEDI